MTTAGGYILETFPDCTDCCAPVDGCAITCIPANFTQPGFVNGYSVYINPGGLKDPNTGLPQISATGAAFRQPHMFYIDIDGFEDNDIVDFIGPGFPGKYSFHFDGTNLNNTFTVFNLFNCQRSRPS